jgi:hypothetical protein
MCKGIANNKCVAVGTTPVPTNDKGVYLTVSVWASGTATAT